MIDFEQATRGWARSDSGARIAPAGVSWCAKGATISVGAMVRIGNKCRINDGAHLGAWARLGDGVHIGTGAYIGAWSVVGDGSRVAAWTIVGVASRIGAGVRIGDGAGIGNWASIGDRARVDAQVNIGDGARIGANATDITDLGWADGYRKCLYYVRGRPYIGAGCRQLTLASAHKHWGNHAEDRRATQAQLVFAEALHALRRLRK